MEFLLSKNPVRTEDAKIWRKLYKTGRWFHGRRQHLEEFPLCELCLRRTRVTAATVVHHRVPPKGDEDLFFDRSNWQSVCKKCHDGLIQSAERRGFSHEIDGNGWPTDPDHPANSRN